MNTTFQKIIKILKNPYILTFLIFFAFSIIIVLLAQVAHNNAIINSVFMTFEIPATVYFLRIGFIIDRIFQDGSVISLTQELLSLTVFSSFVWSLPVWGIIYIVQRLRKTNTV